MAMTFLSPGTLQGAAALVVGVSVVSTLPAGDEARVSTQARHYFQHITLPQIGTRMLSNMLPWAFISSQLVGKYQTFTYIRSCRYVGLSAIAFPCTESNCFPIVCRILDSLN